jgi:hypothetical protein
VEENGQVGRWAESIREYAVRRDLLIGKIKLKISTIYFKE